MKALTTLYAAYSPKRMPWLQLLEDFFQVPRIRLREKVAARMIQKAFRKYKERIKEKELAK